MPARRQLLQKITLNSVTANVTFSNIPQGYTDLRVVMSARSTHNSFVALGVQYNGSSSGQTGRNLGGNGTNAGSFTDQNNTFTNGITFARLTGYYINSTLTTANTFSSVDWHIPNYSGSANKASIVQLATESNHTTTNYATLELGAVLWSNTSPITSLTFGLSSASFDAGSTFYLYGLAQVPVIVGGTETVSGGYKIHTFTATSSLRVVEAGQVEYLVVAGGGGGGCGLGGGGGAGGLLAGRASLSPQSYAIQVGSGGNGSVSITSRGSNGSDSSALSLTATGGGGGTGQSVISLPGANGGSGGGGARNNTSGGTGVSGQGNSGGSGSNTLNGLGGGGGGGAGAVGGSGSGTKGGDGGAGLMVFGAAFAGGGGGGSYLPSAGQGTGGLGGGGNGAYGASTVVAGSTGTVATGGGGGGGATNGSAFQNGYNGGSGIVIIRYPYISN